MSRCRDAVAPSPWPPPAPPAAAPPRSTCARWRSAGSAPAACHPLPYQIVLRSTFSASPRGLRPGARQHYNRHHPRAAPASPPACPDCDCPASPRSKQNTSAVSSQRYSPAPRSAAEVGHFELPGHWLLQAAYAGRHLRSCLHQQYFELKFRVDIASSLSGGSLTIATRTPRSLAPPR